MKNIQVREQVFETNSSSSHSLTLSPDKVTSATFSPKVLRKGVFILTMDDYGWEWKKYYTLENKLRYLYTQLFWEREFQFFSPEEATAELRRDEPRFDLLCRVVQEHTGVELLVDPEVKGAIDHQSCGVGLELFEDEETLKNFLFNENAYVQTGNDNSPPGWKMPTDKQPELTFGPFIKEKPTDSVVLEAEYVNSGPSSLRFDSGVVISEKAHSRLWRKLLKESVVGSMTCFYTAPYKYCVSIGLRSSFAEKLTYARKKGTAFNLAPNFQANQVYKEGKDWKERYVLTLHVPKKLADELQALPVATEAPEKETAEQP